MIKPLLAIAIIIVLILFVSEGLLGQFSTVRFIGTKGNVYGPPDIGIYWTSNATNTVSNIDWGRLEPGLTKNATVYILNEGNEEVVLSLNTTNWQPTNISQYMNLTWNYDGTTIRPNQIIDTTLTLTVSSSPDFINYLIIYDVTAFNFDIVINAAT